MTRVRIILISIGALIVGWFGSSIYNSHFVDTSKDIVPLRENSPDYKFINPLILMTDKRKINFEEYTDLESKISNYISTAKKGGSVKDVSIYFMDLNSAEWIGVNEESLYAPSSMLKVSVLLGYLKLAEDNPLVLSEKLYYNPTSIGGQYYKPRQLAVGYYSVEELLKQMIIESDNDAMRALDDAHIDEILSIYKDLKLPDPNGDALDNMSPRAYSRLFRAIYNGAYISHSSSEEALKLLSQTDFNLGLVSGATSTIVSHKFGELTDIENGVVQEKELHDCGIVYFPGKPYFLCVMTRGNSDTDFPSLQKIISDISSITFNYMEARN